MKAINNCLPKSGALFAGNRIAGPPWLRSMLLATLTLYSVTEPAFAATEANYRSLLERAEQLLSSSAPDAAGFAETAMRIALIRFREEGMEGARQSALRTGLLVPVNHARPGPDGSRILAPAPQIRSEVSDRVALLQLAAIGRDDLVLEHFRRSPAAAPLFDMKQSVWVGAIARSQIARSLMLESTHEISAGVRDALPVETAKLLASDPENEEYWQMLVELAALQLDDGSLLPAGRAVEAAGREWTKVGGNARPLVETFVNVGDVSGALHFVTNHLATEHFALVLVAGGLAAAGQKEKARALIMEVPKESFYNFEGFPLFGRAFDRLSGVDPRETFVQNSRHDPVVDFPYHCAGDVMRAGFAYLDGRMETAESLWSSLPSAAIRDRAHVQVGRELLRQEKPVAALEFVEEQRIGATVGADLRLRIARQLAGTGEEQLLRRTVAPVLEDLSVPAWKRAEASLLVGDGKLAWSALANLEIASPAVVVRWTRLAAAAAINESSKGRRDEAIAVLQIVASRLRSVSVPRSTDLSKRVADTTRLDLATAVVANAFLESGESGEAVRLVDGITSPRRLREVKCWILSQPTRADRTALAEKWSGAEAEPIPKASLLVAQAIGLIEDRER